MFCGLVDKKLMLIRVVLIITRVVSLYFYIKLIHSFFSVFLGTVGASTYVTYLKGLGGSLINSKIVLSLMVVSMLFLWVPLGVFWMI